VVNLVLIFDQIYMAATSQDSTYGIAFAFMHWMLFCSAVALIGKAYGIIFDWALFEFCFRQCVRLAGPELQQ